MEVFAVSWMTTMIVNLQSILCELRIIIRVCSVNEEYMDHYDMAFRVLKNKEVKDSAAYNKKCRE